MVLDGCLSKATGRKDEWWKRKRKLVYVEPERWLVPPLPANVHCQHIQNISCGAGDSEHHWAPYVCVMGGVQREAEGLMDSEGTLGEWLWVVTGQGIEFRSTLRSYLRAANMSGLRDKPNSHLGPNTGFHFCQEHHDISWFSSLASDPASAWALANFLFSYQQKLYIICSNQSFLTLTFFSLPI